VVVIVGGSSGIGLSAAGLFIKNGDRVYNLSRSPSPEPMIHNRTLDVVNFKDIKRSFDEIAADEGPFDILIVSCGFSMAAPFERTETSDIKYLYEVNLIGPAECVKAAIPHMKEGGRMILVSSLAAEIPIAYDACYSSSKAGLNMLAFALQPELRKRGIFITSLMPEGVRTEFSFKRKIYSAEKSGEYEEEKARAASSLIKTEQSGLKPIAVAKEIFFLTELPDPPIYKVVGTKGRIVYGATKLINKRFLYWMCRMKFRV